MLLESSCRLAAPDDNASNSPISLAAKRCFDAMKPMATFMIGSGVTTGMARPRVAAHFRLAQ
jgi:hypothetical protein